MRTVSFYVKDCAPLAREHYVVPFWVCGCCRAYTPQGDECHSCLTKREPNRYEGVRAEFFIWNTCMRVIKIAEATPDIDWLNTIPRVWEIKDFVNPDLYD